MMNLLNLAEKKFSFHPGQVKSSGCNEPGFVAVGEGRVSLLHQPGLVHRVVDRVFVELLLLSNDLVDVL